MELSKNFEPHEIEKKWYSHWMNSGYFKSVPDGREAYTIVMPPPNVTGVLHMGHCLNNTIQDILIRRARMQGKNACWVPGTDHASIATEAKVVAMLRERGITKSSLSREEFLKYAWEWKEKYGGIILEQLKKMGCSLDWDRTSFTMDADYYKSVIEIFVRLHKDGIIYRGLRMVNWDPASRTALSDEEVIFKDVDSKLYYVTYPFADGSAGGITVATTRPETILGDVAICVNPTDERYIGIIGKEVIVPIINRKIKIIADEYVTADFGTGALKITPAHDKNDNEIGNKHSLKCIDTLDEDGKFTAVQLEAELITAQVKEYEGVDRFALRKKIVIDIEAIGGIQKIEEYKGQVGTSERTGAVIESRLSLQWFMDMKKFIATNPDIAAAVADERIKFHPTKAKNTYAHWMDNIKDWCISRQLWWGQQIPAWYDEEGRFVVAENEQKAKEMFNIQYSISNAQLKQDEDCLDTWFSSWLWPMEVFKGISNPDNADINYYYPTTTLVTGQDIIFFWVARMVMAGYAFKQTQPFKDVYFTGMVRDKQGRKMSKQLGNSPDLLLLIEQYGADAVRFGIMIASPAGNDLLFDEGSLEQGRNFNNKLWNALKLVKTVWKRGIELEFNRSKIDANIKYIAISPEDVGFETDTQAFAVMWFKERLNKVKFDVEGLIKQFRLSDALKAIYSLIWDDFCSWYLEWVKPSRRDYDPSLQEPMDSVVYDETINLFSELLLLLHPYMPFITEEIYHLLLDRGDDLCVKQLRPSNVAYNFILERGEILKGAISGIRDVRNKNQIKPKEKIKIYIQTKDSYTYKEIEHILAKQINAEAITYVNDAIAGTITTVIGKDKFYIETEQPLNVAGQKEDLEKELAHLKGFLISVEKKLSNEKFVANAKPEVLAIENKKKADALEKIGIIEESLKSM
jgi:valyl-tRNA synthetase